MSETVTLGDLRLDGDRVCELARRPGGVRVVDEQGVERCRLVIPSEPLVCDDVDCVSVRANVHRLTTLVQAADLYHIRLRDGLRTALAAWAEAEPVMTDEKYQEWQRLNGMVGT